MRNFLLLLIAGTLFLSCSNDTATEAIPLIPKLSSAPASRVVFSSETTNAEALGSVLAPVLY